MGVDGDGRPKIPARDSPRARLSFVASHLRPAAAGYALLLAACGIDAVGAFDPGGGSRSADAGGASLPPGSDSGSGDEGGSVGIDGGDAGGDEPVPPPPASCAEVPSVVDGDATLYVGHDPKKPWTAYCTASHDTYLTLSAGEANNWSVYPNENCATVGAGEVVSVRTAWTRVRIDPTTLVVATNDYTFATSVGATHEMSGDGAIDYTYTKLPFAVGRRCENNGPPVIVARIDFTGTKFRVAANQFLVEGFQASGSAAPVGDAVFLSLKGFPAGIHPCRPGGTDYYQRNGGACLQLTYAP